MKIKKDIYEIDWEIYLRISKTPITPARLKILKVLEKEPKPIELVQLKRLLGTSIDRVTLYRSLESLEKISLIHQSTLGYEVATGRPHHHHAVCNDCGLIEDIEVPHAEYPGNDALKATTQFSHINRYVLDFFGTCKKCAT